MDQGFYVVWNGRTPGVYASWEAARAQVEGFSGARYQSVGSPELAARAFEAGPTDDPDIAGSRPDRWATGTLAVDAACSGNPGPTEYRGVCPQTGDELFRLGPFLGTNNLGEFLAIVHGLGLQHARACRAPVFSDSRTAIGWVRTARVGCTLPRNAETARAWWLAERATAWLRAHRDHVDVIKWPTRAWGEIPADFGRK